MGGSDTSPAPRGADLVGGILAHYGKKGMKWGVRNDKGHEGESAKTKKIEKLDKKFDRESQSLKTTVKLYNSAATRTNDKDIARINNKPEYKDADFRRDSPLRQKYYKEHQDAFLDNLQKAADDMGTNASGTKKYGIVEREDGGWDVSVDDVKHTDLEHADENKPADVQVTYDVRGHIVSIEVNEFEHAEMHESGVIIHYGVKGMKWGVRRAEKKAAAESSEVTVSQKKPGTFAKTVGGKKLPVSDDAKNALIGRQKAKSSTTDALTNVELRQVVERMNLEAQYAKLTFENDRRSTGRRFLDGLFGNKRYSGKKRHFEDDYENAGENARKLADQLRKARQAAVDSSTA